MLKSIYYAAIKSLTKNDKYQTLKPTQQDTLKFIKRKRHNPEHVKEKQLSG